MTGVFENHGMKCPHCGEDDEIDVQAKIWVRLVCDGTDIDESASGDHEWEDDSAVACRGCGHEATVKEFTPIEESKAA